MKINRLIDDVWGELWQAIQEDAVVVTRVMVGKRDSMVWTMRDSRIILLSEILEQVSEGLLEPITEDNFKENFEDIFENSNDIGDVDLSSDLLSFDVDYGSYKLTRSSLNIDD